VLLHLTIAAIKALTARSNSQTIMAAEPKMKKLSSKFKIAMINYRIDVLAMKITWLLL